METKLDTQAQGAGSPPSPPTNVTTDHGRYEFDDKAMSFLNRLWVLTRFCLWVFGLFCVTVIVLGFVGLWHLVT